MSKITLPYYAVLQQKHDGRYLAGALMFPEVSCTGHNIDSLLGRLERHVRELLESAPRRELYRRFPAESPDVFEVTVSLQPSRDLPLWTDPLEIQFETIRWRHGNQGYVAFVPALNIEVFVENEDQLESTLSRQIRYALVRCDAVNSLRTLSQLQQATATVIRPGTVAIEVRSPKSLAQDSEHVTGKRATVLKDTATRLKRGRVERAFEVKGQVRRLAELLRQTPRRSVLLVGPSGVGKTAIIHQLVRDRGKHKLSQSQFWETSGSRLIAGVCGFGRWQERCEQLVKECQARSAILSLGNLLEMVEVGKGGGNRQGVAAFLRPFIARGQLHVITECTPEQWSILQRQSPQLLSAFEKLDIEEPPVSRRHHILAKFARNYAPHVRVESAALETIERFHNRYATYSAWPGRPLRFLRNLLYETRDDKDKAPLVRPSDVTNAFVVETGLPQFLLDDRLPIEVGQVRRWFDDRVMGQASAVERVVDALAVVKSELTRTGRPIASFMFIGPTGVGKTEMAKALAEYLYGDPHRLVRFDMSEFSDPMQVQRLIGGSFAAEGRLTKKLREQPFTVLLLDEIEKAHPLFFDMLLQVLGEGRLTDSAGRLASFCNSIVIMTSNLGAESYGKELQGFAGGSMAQAADDHFVRKVQEFVRPEFFNRIDRIVPFAPLPQEVVQRIALRELEQVRAREGLRFRNVQLHVHDDVVAQLADRGFQPRYGARPLKRAIERELVVPLAEKLNGFNEATAVEAHACVKEKHISVAAKGEPAEVWRIGRQPTSDPVSPANHQLALVEQGTQLRRKSSRLVHSHTMRQIINDLYRMEMAYERQLKKLKGNPTHRIHVDPRMSEFQNLAREVSEIHDEISDAETQALMQFHGSTALTEAPSHSHLEQLAECLREISVSVFLADDPNRTELTCCIFGTQMHRTIQLAHVYRELAKQWKWRIAILELATYQESRKHAHARLYAQRETDDEVPPRVVDVLAIEEWDDYFPDPDAVGLAIVAKGRASHTILNGEVGVHRFLSDADGGTAECLVTTYPGPLVSYEPNRSLVRRRSFEAPVRRQYDLAKSLIRDEYLKRQFHISGRNVTETILQTIQQRMHRLVESMP